MSREDELQEIISKASDELREIRRAEATEQNAPLVGRCYKFRNSYGGGSEKWWLYKRVLSVEGSYGTGWNFQQDCNGKIEIDFDEGWMPLPVSGQEISEEEFMAAWVDLQEKIDAGAPE
jgi:hypothetical protein